MSDTYGDGYKAGYQRNAQFHAWQAVRAGRIAVAWADKDTADVVAQIRKHWPVLAAALDELEVAG